MLDTFAPKKKVTATDNGKMPTVAMPPKPQPQPPKELHAKAAEALSSHFETIDRLETALADVRELRVENEVLQRFNAELQHMVDGERSLKEQYMRYAIKASKSLVDVSRMANQANNEAIEDAERVLGAISGKSTAVDEPALLKNLEKDISAEEISAEFGAGTDEKRIPLVE